MLLGPATGVEIQRKGNQTLVASITGMTTAIDTQMASPNLSDSHLSRLILEETAELHLTAGEGTGPHRLFRGSDPHCPAHSSIGVVPQG